MPLRSPQFPSLPLFLSPRWAESNCRSFRRDQSFSQVTSNSRSPSSTPTPPAPLQSLPSPGPGPPQYLISEYARNLGFQPLSLGQSVEAKGWWSLTGPLPPSAEASSAPGGSSPGFLHQHCSAVSASPLRAESLRLDSDSAAYQLCDLGRITLPLLPCEVGTVTVPTA